MDTIRVGIIGLGANTRLRHVPGLLACEGVEIVGVCNRSEASTQAAAQEYQIEKTYARWEDLIGDTSIDAVVIGTWPYLHCPITLAALDAGKHVLTEARMAMDAAEAHQMLAASQAHPELVTQIVPSPMGFRAGRALKEMIDDGYLGELREVVALGANDMVADPEAPLHWRQSAEYSGKNMLAMGILHEALTRWIPQPVQVMATTQTFVRDRIDPNSGELVPVGTPDCVHVLTKLPSGAQGIYHLSGVVYHGPGFQVHLYGTEGTLKYMIAPEDKLLGARRGEAELTEIEVPKEKEGGWRVEQDFVDAIRGNGTITLTDFQTGVYYMEFTEAVARSAQEGRAINLPLESCE